MFCTIDFVNFYFNFSPFRRPSNSANDEYSSNNYLFVLRELGRISEAEAVESQIKLEGYFADIRSKLRRVY